MPPSAQLATPVGDPDVWRSDSVNSTEWGPAVNVLQSYVADSFCFQKAKRRAELPCEEAESIARLNEWAMTVAPAAVTAAGGTSAGVAASARRQLVRKLRAPKVIAHLPSGPRPPPSELPSLPTAVSVEALDDAYGAWINAVEREALAFSAPGRKEAAAMCGHVFGHSVSFRNALGLPGSQYLKQGFGARRLRLLAGWLMQIVCALVVRALSALETRGDVARWSRACVSWTTYATGTLRARAWRYFEQQTSASPWRSCRRTGLSSCR